MHDGLVKEKEISHRDKKFIFRIMSITGHHVYVDGKDIPMDFNIDDINELSIIIITLHSLLTKYKLIDKTERVVDEKIEEKLNDFDTIIDVLNKYRRR